jgi:hypothetical protein
MLQNGDGCDHPGNDDRARNEMREDVVRYVARARTRRRVACSDETACLFLDGRMTGKKNDAPGLKCRDARVLESPGNVVRIGRRALGKFARIVDVLREERARFGIGEVEVFADAIFCPDRIGERVRARRTVIRRRDGDAIARIPVTELETVERVLDVVEPGRFESFSKAA